MMSLPKSWLVERRASASSAGDEMLHVEDVDAHRRQDLTAGCEVLGLFEEAHQPVLVVHLHDAEAAGFLRRNLDDADGRCRTALAVNGQHPRVVHLVDVIAGEHDEMARVLAQNRVEVLKHRVCGAQIPVLSDALLRAENLDELAEFIGHDAPAHPDVAPERERLVLERDEDFPQTRVDAVAEREVDDPVGTAEVHGRLRPLLGQRIKALARASRQNHDDDIVLHARPSGVLPRPPPRRRRIGASGGTKRLMIADLAAVPPFCAV